MNTGTGMTFQRSLVVGSSLPFVSLPQATQLCPPLPFPQALERTPRGAVPNRCPQGTAARGSPGPPRPAVRTGEDAAWAGACAGHVTAAIRAAGCGLPPSLLAAVTYRRPAPATHPATL